MTGRIRTDNLLQAATGSKRPPGEVPLACGGAPLDVPRYPVAAASASLRISSVSRAFSAENAAVVLTV